METETEYEKLRRAYVANLDFALDLLKKMHADLDEVEPFLEKKYPEKAALLQHIST